MTAKTILLVEDNESDELLTIRAFKKSGVDSTIEVARDGVEALAMLLGEGSALEGALPTMVLLDLNLPKIDGLTVLMRVRADRRTKHLPVIVLTSSKQEEDIVSSYALGANAYVRKPVDFERFAEAAKTLGKFWLQLNEGPPDR